MATEPPPSELIDDPPPPGTEESGALESLDALEERLARPRGRRGLIGLDAGARELNHLTAGLRTGLHLLLGPPSCGKTTFAKQLADQIALFNESPVIFLTTTHNAFELHTLTLGRLSGLPLVDIAAGRSAELIEETPGGRIRTEWEPVEKAFREYRGFVRRLHIVDVSPEFTMRAVTQEALRLRGSAGGGRVAVIVDHLQGLPGSVGTASETASELARLARAIDGPVVAVCAMTHEAYKGNRMPSFNHFTGLGGIETHADTAFALWEDQTATRKVSRDNPSIRRVDLILFKNRHGGLGRVSMDYDPERATFSHFELTQLPFDRFEIIQG